MERAKLRKFSMLPICVQKENLKLFIDRENYYASPPRDPVMI